MASGKGMIPPPAAGWIPHEGSVQDHGFRAGLAGEMEAAWDLVGQLEKRGTKHAEKIKVESPYIVYQFQYFIRCMLCKSYYSSLHIKHFTPQNHSRSYEVLLYFWRTPDSSSPISGISQDEESTKKGEGVRQGRFVLMTDRLFDMADRAPHDHCPLEQLDL